jgi:hypothetical protein
MHETHANATALTCQCGKVRLSATRAPILAASCYCGSCQQAGQEFENLPSASPVRDGDGGTPLVLYRKDRVRCETGREHLEAFRLEPDSPTRRIIAACCNSPMFLDFTKGHWLSIYRKRLAGDAPAIEMRIMTKDRRAGVVLANDVPNYDGYPGKFMLRLILARIAMGFGKLDAKLVNIPPFRGGRKS